MSKNRRLRFSFEGLRLVVVLCLGLSTAQCSLWADGVKRTVALEGGVCKVTLTCEFTGPVKSDLVIEEEFTSGWSVDTESVQLSDMDAFWSSNAVQKSFARFAVPPDLATNGHYEIKYSLKPGLVKGSVSGKWWIYLDDGKVRKSDVVCIGDNALQVSAGAVSAVQTAGESSKSVVESSVSITEFKVLSVSRIKLSYAGLTKSGNLIVEGCENLGKPWDEVKREQVSAGDGFVELEANGCNFYRMKLETKEE